MNNKKLKNLNKQLKVYKKKIEKLKIECLNELYYYLGFKSNEELIVALENINDDYIIDCEDNDDDDIEISLNNNIKILSNNNIKTLSNDNIEALLKFKILIDYSDPILLLPCNMESRILELKSFVDGVCHRFFSKSFCDAEEIANDTLMNALKYYKNFHWRCSLKTWLHKIATNLCLNRYHYLRRRKFDKHISFDQPVEDDNDDFCIKDIVADETEPVYNLIDMQNLTKRVNESRNHLKNDDHRNILKLRIIHNMSYKSISETLNINIGTVKSRIKRARDSLKDRMNGELSELKC